LRTPLFTFLATLALALGGCPGSDDDDSGAGDDDATSDDDDATSDDDDATGDDDDATGDDDDDDSTGDGPLVRLETNLGEMVLELNDELAPITVANFLVYVDEGFYDGTDGLGATTFHRVMSGFMIQGGGMTDDMLSKATHDAIVNESYNGLSNLRGTVAMARTSQPDTATSQFFINHVDNEFLDIDGQYPPGYAVFGELIEGLDVLDTIAAVPTETVGQHEYVPQDPVIILAAERL
jgi:cyclophilin family peptidyl-prolyl cis-trans isomerase